VSPRKYPSLWDDQQAPPPPTQPRSPPSRVLWVDAGGGGTPMRGFPPGGNSEGQRRNFTAASTGGGLHRLIRWQHAGYARGTGSRDGFFFDGRCTILDLKSFGHARPQGSRPRLRGSSTGLDCPTRRGDLRAIRRNGRKLCHGSSIAECKATKLGGANLRGCW